MRRTFHRLSLLLFLITALAAPACRLAMDIPDGPDSPCDGDGIRDPGETCDGTDLGDATCEGFGYHEGALACTAACRWDASDCQAGGSCGDGAVQLTFEDCEGAQLGDATCESLGFSGGVLSCGEDCAFDTSRCESICNSDGIKDLWETCDREDLGDATCESLGYHAGTLTCTSACTYGLEDCAREGRCGDGELNPAYEECEPGNAMVTSCESLGYHAGTLACGADCFLDMSGCEGRCGDGVLQSAYEECDGADLGGADCGALGFYPGILQCTTACGFNTTGCTGRCGDGLLQPAYEQCEPGLPGGTTCRSLSHFTGDLCDGATCQHDESRCLDATALTTGSAFTCVLLSDATVRCWGNNGAGQLGTGVSSSGSSVPVPATALPAVVSIHAGGNHACARRPDDTLTCWGYNSYGQVGTGNTLTPQVTPTVVSGLAGVKQADPGEAFTCVLLENQSAHCWGRNIQGQLGNGNTFDQLQPTAVSLIPSVLRISTGAMHACAIVDPGGALRCWGENNYGQLGDDSTTDRSTPVTVSTITGVYAVAAGGSHTCAIDTTGTTWCWGQGNSGQIGDGMTFGNRTVPVQPDWTQTAIAIAAGYQHTCAITVGGSVYCWGENSSGQCGSGSTSDRSRPSLVSSIANAVAITAGDAHTCVLLGSGIVRCWGLNNYGQLGDGTTANRLLPIEVLP